MPLLLIWNYMTDQAAQTSRPNTPSQSQAKITEDLLSSGLRRGAVVLLHLSLRSLGQVPGGAETVIRGLLDALGARGTLLMPALSYQNVTPARPVFHVLRTPSNVGAIPEYFRTRPGTIRSINPTHSVCGIGPQAETILKNHHLDETPCGAHSAYRILRDIGGQIIFIGCGLEPNTSMHGVEELVNPPYLFGPTITYQVILASGKEIRIKNRRHNFSGWAQRYDRLGPLLKDEGLKTGKVLAATMHLIESRIMWERALGALKRNPLFFVEKPRWE